MTEQSGVKVPLWRHKGYLAAGICFTLMFVSGDILFFSSESRLGLTYIILGFVGGMITVATGIRPNGEKQ